MYSALSQFDVYSIINLSVLNSYLITITNMNLVFFSVTVFFFLIYFVCSEEISIIPKKIQYVYEMIYLFVFDVVYSGATRGLHYFPFLLTIFVMVLFLNIVSLFPFSFAVSAHFIWSLYLSLSTCLGVLITGLAIKKLDYLKIFLMDIPLMLYPLMTVIELASYVIRAFSLAIRLSANIIAGHILIDIIAEVAALLNYYLIDLAFIVIALLIALMFLEIGVACLQAYVLLLLITIYLNDAVSLHSGH